MSIIRAGTTTTTALTSIGNTDGTIQLQVNGTTPSVTLNTLGAVGVGAVPNFGSSGQALVSGGATAAPTWANVTTSPAGTTGQVQINNAGAFGAVSSGTTGQVLTSQGAGAAPVFATPSAGALVFLSSVTANNSATVDLETTFNSTYDQYMIALSGVVTGGDPLRIRLRVGGTYQTSAFYNFTSNITGSTTDESAITVIGSTSATLPVDGFVYAFNPTATTTWKKVYWDGITGGSTAAAVLHTGIGFFRNSTDALTGVRFFNPFGNIQSGTFRLYGIAKS